MKKSLFPVIAALCVWGSLAASDIAHAANNVMNASDININGMTLTIKSTGDKFDIQPAATRHHEMTGVIKAGEPTWRSGLRLPGPAWIFRCLTPGSLKITLQSDPAVQLQEGKDYIVNMDWASVCSVKGSKYAPGTKLAFSYDYGYSRLDLLVRHSDGRLDLIKGKEDKGRPALPETPENATALLSVYQPANTQKLTLKNINFIDTTYSLTPPVRLAQYTENARQKFQSGKGLTVVFLGDSITAQKPRDFTDKKGSFVDRFSDYLVQRFGKDKVTVTMRDQPVARKEGEFLVVKSGVGGNTTVDAVKRLQSDVLDHKPDLVIVLFGANDENKKGKGNNVPLEKYRGNLIQIVQQCRKAKSDVIIMTPAMKNLGWSSTVGNMDQYARMADMVAESQGATLVDCYYVWENFPKIGYNYMVALGTCINHPVDIGHKIFFQGIKAVLEKEK